MVMGGMPGRAERLSYAEYTDGTQDAQSVIEQLKKAVFRGRIRMTEFFSDFDPLRTGAMSAHKFRTALVACGAVHLTERQLQVLTLHFIDPADSQRVRYLDLLTEIETVFTTANMQYDPFSTGNDFTPALIKDTTTLPPAHEEAVMTVLARLAHLVKTKGLLLRQPFDDYMKNVNSPKQVDEVTYVQFRNGLGRCGLEVSGEEAELIALKFPGSAKGYVNYVSFVCAIDVSERASSSRMPQANLLAASERRCTESQGFRVARTVEGRDQPGRMDTATDRPTLHPETSHPRMRPEGLDSLLQSLQNKALQHRLRVSEFLRDADKHRDGTITVPQFATALSMAFDKMHINLSEKQMALLVQHYAKPMVHGATHVQWRLFAADVEAVFTKPYLEQTPLEAPVSRLVQHNPHTLQPAAREEAVQALLESLRQRVLVRRVLVKPFFADYEQQVNSAKVIDHITRNQTVQALSRFGVELSVAQAELLFDRYDTLGDGGVNFVALVRDVDPYENFSGRQTSHHVFPQDPQFHSMAKTGVPSGGFWKSKIVDGPLLNQQPGRPNTNNDVPRGVKAPTGQSAAEIVLRLQRASLQSRVRVEEGFKDFDRHRCGAITIPQFTIGMRTVFGRDEPISQADFETLVKHYAIERPGCVHFKWKQFVDDVNYGVGANTLLHRTPTTELVTPTVPPTDWAAMGQLTPNEELQLHQLLARFRHFTLTRRMLIKPYFHDAETNRRSMRVVDHVTRPQFEACLARLGLEASNEELEILIRKFSDKPDGYVNYVAFTRTIDSYESSSDRHPDGKAKECQTLKGNGGFWYQKTMPTQPGRAPPQMDFPRLNSEHPAAPIGLLLKRLSDRCVQYGVNGPHNFFSDYDRHVRGTCTIPQFRAALFSAFGASYMKTDLTEKECQLLEETYARTMIDGEVHVRWKDFCNDIAAQVVPPNLEYDPLHDTSSPGFTPLIERKERQLSPEEEARLEPLLKKMRDRFSIREVYVKGPFHDFALSNNSPKMIDHVTRQQFVQGLSRLGLEPSPQDFELLFKKYDDDGVGNINYVAFARSVDALETFSDRSKASSDARNTLYGGWKKPKVPLDYLASFK